MIHEPGCPVIADDDSDYEFLDDAGRCVCVAPQFADETEQTWANFRILHPELYPERAKWKHWPFPEKVSARA